MKLVAKFENRRSPTRGAKPAEQTLCPAGPPTAADHSATPAARNLALAHRLAQMIDRGLVADYTAAARMLGVSQPRLTHLMGLLLLAPQIQEAILFGTLRVSDKELRNLARIPAWSEQLAALARR